MIRGFENRRGRRQRVDRRVEPERRDLPRQLRRRVEVRERGGRRRVGVVVGRHVDRLHRGDRALVGGCDPLLHLAHLGQQGRLIADRGGHAAEERRDLGAGLRKPEDVVDKEENVLALRVAKILRNRERAQRDTEPRPGRLRHLAIDERRARLLGLLQVDDPTLLHLVPEVVPLAGPLTDATKHRHTAVLEREVVDELHDDDGLADARAAKEPDLAAAHIRLEQVDDLDAALEHLALGRLIHEGRRGPVNRPALVRLDRAVGEVDRLAEHVEHTTERLGPDRHRDGGASVGRRHAPLHPVGRRHRHGADAILTQMLLDLRGDDDVLTTWCRRVDLQRVVDRRQVSTLELHVQHRSDDLDNLAHTRVCVCHAYLGITMRPRPTRPRSARA